MEQEKPQAVRRRMTGAGAFTVGAFAGAVNEAIFPGEFANENPISTSLFYGAIGGGIILPMFQRVVPPYTIGERGVFTAANASGVLAGIMLVRAIRQYL